MIRFFSNKNLFKNGQEIFSLFLFLHDANVIQLLQGQMFELSKVLTPSLKLLEQIINSIFSR